eukprot:7186543-Prymnesium_polylepis.1
MRAACAVRRAPCALPCVLRHPRLGLMGANARVRASEARARARAWRARAGALPRCGNGPRRAGVAPSRGAWPGGRRACDRRDARRQRAGRFCALDWIITPSAIGTLPIWVRAQSCDSLPPRALLRFCSALLSRLARADGFAVAAARGGRCTPDWLRTLAARDAAAGGWWCAGG